MPAIDLSGMRFSRLSVVERVANDRYGNAKWRCLCDCGVEVVTVSTPLRSGRTKSCGCLTTEQLIGRITSHKQSRTPEYRIWAAMLQRCKFARYEKYRRYAGRGIKVCDRWHDFANFIADMGPRPSPTYTLERQDSNGHYTPDNCSWELRVVQNNNTSRNHMVIYQGQRMTIAQAMQASGTKISDSAVHDRIKRGWPIEQALATPPRQQPN